MEFILPFETMRLVSRQGWRPSIDGRVVSPDVVAGRENIAWHYHNGTDWTNADGETEGMQLRAGAAGRALYADSRGGVSPFVGYGNAVVLEYYPGVMSLFAHCRDVLIAAGETVAAGQPVSTIGRTARPGHLIGGAHLHWELVVKWPLQSSDTGRRYDVLQTMSALGFGLNGRGVLVRGGTPGRITTPPPTAGVLAASPGLLDIALIVGFARLLRERRA